MTLTAHEIDMGFISIRAFISESNSYFSIGDVSALADRHRGWLIRVLGGERDSIPSEIAERMAEISSCVERIPYVCPESRNGTVPALLPLDKLADCLEVAYKLNPESKTLELLTEILGFERYQSNTQIGVKGGEFPLLKERVGEIAKRRFSCQSSSM